MSIDSNAYQATEARFRAIFKLLAPMLSVRSQENVEHFLNAAEIEMACESFVLSLIEDGVDAPSKTKEDLLKLCKELKLDKEAVFRADFWDCATLYLAK
jgi:hypothetical protein